jgi:hypothetical protein
MARTTSAQQGSLDDSIAKGRGGILLGLTDEQYLSAKVTLKRSRTAA